MSLQIIDGVRRGRYDDRQRPRGVEGVTLPYIYSHQYHQHFVAGLKNIEKLELKNVYLMLVSLLRKSFLMT